MNGFKTGFQRIFVFLQRGKTAHDVMVMKYQEGLTQLFEKVNFFSITKHVS